MKNIRANIWKIYAYKLLSDFWLIVPILIPFYKSNDLDSTQVFVIQAGYALAILLTEIPSGYLADVVGRRKTLILGSIFLPIGLAVYVLTHTFVTFLLAELILALGNSMRSGCDSAMVYDTLLQLKEEARYTRYEGQTAFFTRIGTAASSILGGLAAVVSLKLPFYFNIATSICMLPLALALIEPTRKKRESQTPFRDILGICKASFQDPLLRNLMFVSAFIAGCQLTALWGYFLYYQWLHIPLSFFGVLFALFQVSCALGSQKAHVLEKRLGLKTSFHMLFLVGLGLFMLTAGHSYYLVLFVFFNGYLWGFFGPIYLDQVNRQISSEIRATVLSVSNMVGSLAFVIVSPLFGRIVDRFSLPVAFRVLGIFYICALSIPMTQFFKRYQQAKETGGK